MVHGEVVVSGPEADRVTAYFDTNSRFIYMAVGLYLEQLSQLSTLKSVVIANLPKFLA